ncbi:hypothetical protein [Burkholderia gladioli]|uniref:Uncharacterized protein n=1 Tax=Burkholderia gladioli (strain BSR3) TaxID=999541 RepID=F2LTF4_BURGS|nr:hypothetical protein [Burkholderia gladioli]AEA66100.1 hypothetical protein bgla_4p3540 [Burkholderia gladioli BSR3]
MDVAVPVDDMYVTACEQVGSALQLRFVYDFHPASPRNEQVLQISLEGLGDVSTYVEFFRDLLYTKPIYLERDENTLTATAGATISLSMKATALTLSYDSLNLTELRKEVDVVFEWYLNTDRSLAKAYKRIDTIRGLTAESIRRIELKSSGHARGGTASVLYEQQLHLLNRILQLLEE